MKLFGKKKPKIPQQEPGDPKEPSIEDLVTLERYEEAEIKLKERLKIHKKDLHGHLKLAEVYLGQKDVQRALIEYTFVADSYAEDGFFDKGIALLGKATKLAPGDDNLPRRIEKYKRLKRLESRRRAAIDGMLANKSTASDAAANRALEMEMLWGRIAKSHLVDKLDSEKLKRLFSVMQLDRLEADTTLVEQGGNHDYLYLIVDGQVEAITTVGAQTFTIKGFTTGDVIGESALLERKTWPANYKILKKATVFRLDRQGLGMAMQGNDDPVGFLSVLREQNHDRDVARKILEVSRR